MANKPKIVIFERAAVVEPPATFNGEWNRRRFHLACAAKGVGTTTQFIEFMRARTAGEDADARSEQTWRRVYMGTTDPTRSGGAHGRLSMIVEIALALGVSIDWLLSEDVEVAS